jgi:hypothetical protein
MATKIFLSILGAIAGIAVLYLITKQASSALYIVSLAIGVVAGYFLGEVFYRTSLGRRGSLRKKIFFLGLVISIGTGAHIVMGGYMGPIFGPVVAIGWAIVSYIVGLILEKIDIRT